MLELLGATIMVSTFNGLTVDSTSLPPVNCSNTGSDSPSTIDNDKASSSNMHFNKPSEPDADTIKMFVGQIPRHWSELECRQLFEEFGPVYQLNVLRDKNTHLSRGCCFVTFYHRKDAINAQSTLHNLRVLEGMHHAVQMKPADMENKNERKLFVGMLNKKLNENDVRQMFTKFGPIEDCQVLRDNDGKSRGCAFVTFSSRAIAQTAIRHMHNALTCEGCNLPIVVKFADTQRKNDPNKQTQQGQQQSQATTSSTSLAQLPAAMPQTLAGIYDPSRLALAQMAQNNPLAFLQQQQLAMLAPTSGLSNQLNALNPLTLLQNNPATLQQQQLVQLQQQLLQQQTALLQQHQLPVTSQPASLQTQQLLAYQQLLQQQNPATSIYNQGTPTTYTSAAVLQQQSPLAAASAPTIDLTSLYGGGQAGKSTTQNGQGTQGLQHSQLLAAQQQALLQQQHSQGLMQSAWAGLQQYNAMHQAMSTPTETASPALMTGQREGPPGANLFIYHLPQEFGDNELAQTFSPFGTILSAKVFVEPDTNLSKCFGFISYDNAASAASAIHAMNGFVIGMKKLKVQLKKNKADNKPYAPPVINGYQATMKIEN